MKYYMTNCGNWTLWVEKTDAPFYIHAPWRVCQVRVDGKMLHTDSGFSTRRNAKMRLTGLVKELGGAA